MNQLDQITSFDETIRKQLNRTDQAEFQHFKDSNPEILGVLARGGMATIYEAEQRVPVRKVVIKKIDNVQDDDLQYSLYQEAMIMGALDHPNIIPVHQIIMQDGQPAVVMKLVRGQTFKEKIQSGCTALEAIRVVVQVCYAVEYAHQQGIIHRDIKPSNIMIGDFNEIYLLDWGIAIDTHNYALAMDGLVGSPSFMAPEMLSGDPHKITPQTDIYLLGSTLHYALTGERRYETDSLAKLFTYIEDAKPIVYDTNIPKELGMLLNQACHRDSTQRPASVKEFQTALKDISIHWEIIQLSKEGIEKSRQCVQETTPEMKQKLFEEAHQDLQYAQRIWANAVAAKEERKRLLLHMVEWYIKQKKPRLAHSVYLMLDEAHPTLLQEITVLLEGDVFLNEEQRRLLRIGQANDFHQTRATSATFAMLIGVGAICFALWENVAHFVFQKPVSMDSLLYSALAILVLILILMYTRRTVWLHNRSMERMCISALGTLVFISLNRFIGMYNDVGTDGVLAIDCLAIGLGTLMVAQIVHYGYIFPMVCITLGLVATFVPTLALPCLSLITLIVPFGTWWAWKNR